MFVAWHGFIVKLAISLKSFLFQCWICVRLCVAHYQLQVLSFAELLVLVCLLDVSGCMCVCVLFGSLLYVFGRSVVAAAWHGFIV